MRTDGSFHGLFILAPLPTAWVSMRRRRNGLPRIFRMRRVVWENVTRWACLVCEKSVGIREICGRQLSAQCAKEQAGCFYSPTDLSDKHRCHADCLSITQIAPSARQIDTDFSHAESCVGECHTMGLLGMRKICGNPRDLWATTKRAMR